MVALLFFGGKWVPMNTLFKVFSNVSLVIRGQCLGGRFYVSFSKVKLCILSWYSSLRGQEIIAIHWTPPSCCLCVYLYFNMCRDFPYFPATFTCKLYYCLTFGTQVLMIIKKACDNNHILRPSTVENDSSKQNCNATLNLIALHLTALVSYYNSETYFSMIHKNMTLFASNVW
jgi:hypothetical protein